MNRNKKGQASQNSPPKKTANAAKKKKKQQSVSLSAPGVQYSRTVPARLVTRRRAYASISAPRHTPYGDEVVEVRGSQQFSTVSNTGASASLFGASTVLPVSPDAIGGTLAGIANRYSKYYFKELEFEFVPYQPNSTDGHGFAFGFNPEGGTVNEFTSNFANLSTLTHSMVLPMTGYIGGTEMNTLCVKPSRSSNPWYWNEDDVATIAGSRQTIQGTFAGASDSAITNATTWGTIWLHYVIEFCDMTPDQGFTLSSLKSAIRRGRFDKSVLLALLSEPDTSSSSSKPLNTCPPTPLEVRNGRWVTLG